MAAGDNSPIYDDLMRFKPDDLTPNGWAIKAGVSRTVWSDMRRHGNPSRRTLEKLLTVAGSSLAEFEALRIGGTENERIGGSVLADRRQLWGPPHIAPLPLLATAMGGEWGSESIEMTLLRTNDLVDRIPRPAALVNDPTAYAVTIVGDSMWPRFRPGRRLAVSAKSPVAIGDDVLVKLKDGMSGEGVAVLVKELVRRSGSGVELRQFNPAITFEVPAAAIEAVEKVLGELI